MAAMSAHLYQRREPKSLLSWAGFRITRCHESPPARPTPSAPATACAAPPVLFTSPGFSSLGGLLISGAVSAFLWGIVVWSAWALLS